MIAMLGMYDMPALQPTNDRFWQATRSHLGYGPDQLTRDMEVWDVWQSPDLLLSQTCGYPYRAKLHDRVTYITTPDYGLPDCPPGYYTSCIVVRADDPADGVNDLNARRFAYNDPLSQSGWAAPMAHLTDAGITPASLVQTGAHRASALAVANGTADFAAIDAQTWRLLSALDDATHGLRVLATTPPTPGLPLITSATRDPAPLCAALNAALTDLSADDQTRLGLNGFVQIPKAAYLSVATPPPPHNG